MTSNRSPDPVPSVPQDPRRSLCRELAQLLAGPDGVRAARLLELSGVMRPVPPVPSEDVPEAAGTSQSAHPEGIPEAAGTSGARPISLWQPHLADGELCFVRPAPRPLGDHHAARRQLRAARTPGMRRVCFFGESVAAGYLYAPHLTPAEVLEHQLGAASGSAFEVIDLARTNETLGSLAATVEAALQLKPDALVVFAGNNWNLLETPEVSPYVPAVRSRQRYALALRAAGLAGPPQLAARQLERRATATLDRLAALARGAGVPLVLVIPEVNLADWESRQPVPWLPGDGVARWYETYFRTLDQLAAGAWDEAAAGAAELLRLDGGLCPTGHRLLARARAGQGRFAAARAAARAEVDAASYSLLCFLGAPQITTAGRQLLQDAARRHSLATVDLVEVFAQHTPWPGRELFLDYCHLSLEGIRLAMAATAGEVLRALDLAPARDPLALPPPALAAAAAALAHFGAAVHSAHRLLTTGPRQPLLDHACQRALAASPGIADTLRDFAAARCAPLPAVLTAAQQRNLDSPYRLLHQHGWRWDYLDAEVLETLASALGDDAELRQQLLAHHRLDATPHDLTQPPYPWEPLERFYPDVMTFDDLTTRATWRSPWPEATFCLPADAAADVVLRLTARLPAIPGTEVRRQGAVKIAVNGSPVATVELGERWSRSTLHVPRALLRPGLNRLTVRWPMPPPVGEAALAAAIERLEQGIEADLHPVFGEIFALQAATTA